MLTEGISSSATLTGSYLPPQRAKPPPVVISPDMEEKNALDKSTRPSIPDSNTLRYSSESSVSSQYHGRNYYPYVEIGKQLQELRTIVRVSCSPDNLRISRGSAVLGAAASADQQLSRTQELRYQSHTHSSNATTKYQDYSNEDVDLSDLPDIKIKFDSTPQRLSRHVAATPHGDGNHPKNAATTGDHGRSEMIKDQVDKILDQNIHQSSHKGDSKYVLRLGDTRSHLSRHWAMDDSEGPDSASHWKQLAHNLELQLEESQRAHTSELVAINREHEELEERQQLLLEDMGQRLSQALRGEQFWKQTLGKVISARKRRQGDVRDVQVEGGLETPQQPSRGDAATLENETVLTTTGLRRELKEDGIDVPADIFENLAPSSDNVLKSFDGKLLAVSRRNIEILRQKNAVLSTTLSALLSENLNEHKSQLRRFLLHSNKAYYSADDSSYLKYLPLGPDAVPPGDLGEYKSTLRCKYDSKLHDMRSEISALQMMHSQELKSLSDEHKAITESELNSLKSKWDEEKCNMVKSLTDSIEDARRKHDLEMNEASLQHELWKKRELYELRRSIETEYTEEVSHLSEQIRSAKEQFINRRQHLTDELSRDLAVKLADQEKKLREYFEAEKKHLESERDSRILQLKQELIALRENLVDDLQRSKQCAVEELRDRQSKVLNNLKQEVATLRDANESKLRELSAEYDEKLKQATVALADSLKREHEDALSSINQEVTQAVDDFEIERQKLLSHYKIQEDSELIAATDNLNLVFSEEVNRYQQQLNTLDEIHRLDVEALKDEYKAALDHKTGLIKLEAQQKYSIERASLLERLNDLRESYKQQLESENVALSTRMKSLLESSQQSMRREHEEKLDYYKLQLSSSQDGHSEAIRCMTAKFSGDLENETNLYRFRIEDDYSSEICRMSDEIIFLRNSVPEKAAHNTNDTAFGSQLLDSKLGELRKSLEEKHSAEINRIQYDFNGDLKNYFEKIERMQSELEESRHEEFETLMRDHKTTVSELTNAIDSLKFELSVSRTEQIEETTKRYQRDQEISVVVEKDLILLKSELNQMKEHYLEQLLQSKKETTRLQDELFRLKESSAQQSSEDVMKKAESHNIKLKHDLDDAMERLNLKTQECDQLLLRLDAMHRLIEIYKGNYHLYEETQNIFLAYDNLFSSPTRIAHRNYNEGRNTQTTLDAVSSHADIHSSECTLSALRQAVKERNSAKKINRQQQLCILALRILVKNTEKKYERLKQKLACGDII